MKRKELAAIGTRLKKVRKHLDLQQNTMADALGITSAYLSEIENGKSTPSGEVFLKIVDTYNISLEYLFLNRGEMLYKKIPGESFTFDAKIDSIEKLAWMMNKSDYFKSSMLTAAQKLMLEQDVIIRKSLLLNEEEKNRPPATPSK